jgi:hypothetical protein
MGMVSCDSEDDSKRPSKKRPIADLGVDSCMHDTDSWLTNSDGNKDDECKGKDTAKLSGINASLSSGTTVAILGTSTTFGIGCAPVDEYVEVLSGDASSGS